MDHVGDEVCSHANNGNKRDGLEGADDLEGRPEGAEGWAGHANRGQGIRFGGTRRCFRIQRTDVERKETAKCSVNERIDSKVLPLTEREIFSRYVKESRYKENGHKEKT